MAKIRKLSSANALKNLRVFCVAARRASFKQAGDDLFITASAVSHQIRTLEERIGFELFERKSRKVTLTARGADLLDSIGPLMDRIYAEVNDAINARPQVSLHVVLPPFFATEIFIPRLAEFTDQNPGIDIYLDTADVRPSKLSTTTDLAVLLCKKPPQDRQSSSLCALELVPACAPSYNPEENFNPQIDYGTATLIVHRQRRDAWKRWFREMGLSGQQSSRILELDSMSDVVQSAERGIGVALVPNTLSSSRFESGRLQRLPGKELLTGDEYFLSWQQSAANEEQVSALVDWIRDII